MKASQLLLAGASLLLLGACSTYTPLNGPTVKVGPEYVATGHTAGVRAYVYGGRTLIEFQNKPAFVDVVDASGQQIAYEREGTFYRLDRALYNFSVQSNLFKRTSFHLIGSQQPVTVQPGPQKVQRVIRKVAP